MLEGRTKVPRRRAQAFVTFRSQFTLKKFRVDLVQDPSEKQRRFEANKRVGFPNDTVDGCEILHQLIDGKHPIIYQL